MSTAGSNSMYREAYLAALQGLCANPSITGPYGLFSDQQAELIGKIADKVAKKATEAWLK